MFILPNLLLWYLWIFICLIIHEGGHAVAARIVRFRVFAVIIGYGKNLFDFEVLGVPIELNLKPFNGITYAFPKNYTRIKIRFWFFNFGGLATHLAFMWLYLKYFYRGLESFLPGLAENLGIWETFFLANLFLFATNAFPYKYRMPQGPYLSDGYKLFQIPFMKVEDILAVGKMQKGFEAWNYLRKGENEKALELYEKILAENPEDNVLKHDIAIAKLKFGNYREARELLLTLLESPEFEPPHVKMLLFNNIAYLNSILGGDDLLKEADQMSFAAYNSNPTFVIYIGTRGSVLVRLGQYVTGLELLMDAYGKTSRHSGRAQIACFIALGHAKLGRFKEVNRWLKNAKKNDAENKLIPIFEQEIENIQHQNL